VKGLWSLGEFAFRELLMFFDKVDTKTATVKFACDINVSKVVMGGKIAK
jgi:hypothetical protein